MRGLGIKKRAKAQKIIKVVHIRGYAIVDEVTKKLGVIHMQAGEPMEVEVRDGNFLVNNMKFVYKEKEDKQQL